MRFINLAPSASFGAVRAAAATGLQGPGMAAANAMAIRAAISLDRDRWPTMARLQYADRDRTFEADVMRDDGPLRISGPR